MPMTVAADGPIPNRFIPGAAHRNAAPALIAQLDYDDLWRGQGTLHTEGALRLDMQGSFVGPNGNRWYNLQVQVNGITGHSTIAQANVCETIQTADKANQRGAAGKAISALNQSLDSGNKYKVSGTNP
ncbi:MAG: hypothetical protein AAGF87_08345 [Bacteroidota bacterium]